MAFSNAKIFQIDRSVFDDIQGDYNHQRNRHRHIHGDLNQQINAHDQDIRSLIHSAMKAHIHTDAFYNSSARRHPSSCYPGTRKAALETISSWIKDPASHCLWLHGPAGTGKSTIAQTVAEQCNQDKTLGASYFFTRGLVSGPPLLFPTLAYQLMSAVPDLDVHLWEMICEDRTVFQRSMTEQLDRLIVRPFLKLTLDNRPAYIVVIIDALDECGGTSVQEEIIQLILGVRAHSLPLRFLITSRSEPDIQRAFESSPHLPPFHLPLDASLDPDRDIRHFLSNELWWIYQQSVENGTLVAPGFTWPSSEAIDQLVEKSSGHFIYALTVVKFIQEEDVHLIERLDVMLQIPSECSSPATMNPSTVPQSAALQHLDQLYLHILRKGSNPGNRAELARVLHAVDTNNPTYSVDTLDAVFAPTGGVRLLLREFRSFIEVTPDHEVRFLHASLSDFLKDPARSCEFHLDLGHFNADLAYQYARLIALLSPTGLTLLTLAMNNFEDCLRGTHVHPGLLSITLRKIAAVIDSEPSKSMLPCLRYSGLDYLLRTLRAFPESSALRKKIKTIQLQLRPQLTELSDTIFTLVRVLGANFALHSAYAGKFSLVELGQFIGMPNGQDSEAIVRRALGLNYADLQPQDYGSKPVREIRRSLSRWFLVHRRRAWGITMAPVTRGILYPPTIMVDKYTWTSAWDTVAYLPDADEDTVHHLDVLYCCLRTLLLGFHQPLIRNHGRDTLCYPAFFVRFYLTEYGIPTTIAYWVLKGINFSSVWQALSTLGIDLYPRLVSLQGAFDGFFVGFGCKWVHLADKSPSLDCFLQNMYSRLVQDSLVSRTIPITYALFVLLDPRRIEQLLDLPGLCTGSPIRLEFSAWLSKQLKSGRVKLRHGLFNNAVDENHNNYSIEDYMCDAHECLTIACAKHLASRHVPSGASPTDDTDHEVETYAKRYWSSHLRYTNHSERLFEALRRVVTIQRDDVEDVIQWLEKTPGVPEDILFRWRAARLDHGAARGPLRELDISLFDQYSWY